MPPSKKIPIGQAKKIPTVTVVTPTYNEATNIPHLFASLQKQTFTDFEVVIVDDGSSDDTIVVAKKYDLTLVTQSHKGAGLARNNGVQHAKGKIIAFLDADMVLDKHYLKNLIKPIQEKKTHGTTHDKEFATNLDNPWSRCWGKVRIDPTIDSRSPRIYRAILKKTFLSTGGFDPARGYADDQSLNEKIGFATLAPNTLCYHSNPLTLQETYIQARWIGGSYPKKTFFALLVCIALVALAFLYLVPLYGASVAFPLVFVPLVLLYLIFVILMTFRTIQRENDWSLLYLYPGFITVRVAGTIHGVLRNFTGNAHQR